MLMAFKSAEFNPVKQFKQWESERRHFYKGLDQTLCYLLYGLPFWSRDPGLHSSSFSLAFSYWHPQRDWH